MPIISRFMKSIIIACIAIFLLQTIFPMQLERIFGFTPKSFLTGFVWQPITYMFLHGGVFHLLMNMLVLAMFGSELERLWGQKFFYRYYFICGIGSVLIHFAISLTFVSSQMNTPVIGASGGLFGLLLAYGLLFPHRTLLFMFIFPMKAKYFLGIVGAMELYFAFTQNTGQVAYWVHLSGMAVGYLYLVWESRRRQRNRGQSSTSIVSKLGRKKTPRHLKIVVSND